MCISQDAFVLVPENPTQKCLNTKVIYFYYLKKFYLFLSVLSLHCAQAFLQLRRVGTALQLRRVGFSLWWLLFWSPGFSCCGNNVGSVVAAPGLWSTGSIVVAHGLSCSVARRIFPNQGSNECLPHWQTKFFTPEPPRKSGNLLFCVIVVQRQDGFTLVRPSEDHERSDVFLSLNLAVDLYSLILWLDPCSQVVSQLQQQCLMFFCLYSVCERKTASSCSCLRKNSCRNS